MGWKVTLGDKSVLLDDLSPATFQKIADAHAISWLDVYNAPAADIEAYYDLLCAVAEHCSAEPPPKPATIKDAHAMLDLLQKVEEHDRPKATTRKGTSTRSSEADDPATR